MRWAFSMVLSFSRHLFVYPVLVMDQQAWVWAHAEAFSFYGSVPRRIVCENVPWNIFELLWPMTTSGS